MYFSNRFNFQFSILFLLMVLGFGSFKVLAQNSKPYFQQRVNTTMTVQLDDVNHSLSAYTSIEYINNSPDVLDFIYIHLWPNAYKNVNTALAQQVLDNGELKFQFAKDHERGYIDSLDFKVDGVAVVLEYDPNHVDIAKIILNKPLKPGSSLVITTPFFVKIPVGVFSRLGHIGQSYQITQWFPKPAVYDREGWHPLPYLSQGEFYSEYGSYDVKITVPKNYVLGATGDMQNADEEMKWLEQKVLETQAIIDTKSYAFNADGSPNMDFPDSDVQTKTLHFIQDNVHDFAWFCDKRYHVLKGEVTLPYSKQKVTSWAMFTNSEFKLWERSIEYLNDAIYYYSLWNGDYPYGHVTAVDGSISAGGGMEYPNITVIGKSYTPSGLEQVIVHEVGHNWFYGILGSNERTNAWMDEGINTFNENRYQETKYPGRGIDLGLPTPLMKKAGIDHMEARGIYDLGYEFAARRNYDQPLSYSSEKFTNLNYGGLVYGKSAIGLDFMLDYLGSEVFDTIMHRYFEEWKFKHPQPNDLRAIFESHTGKDLSWFFDDFIKTTKKIDYALTKVKNKEGNTTVTIKNLGQLKAPVFVSALKNGDPIESYWIDGFEGASNIVFKTNEASYFVIDHTLQMPEINRRNNQIKSKGIFKTVEPLKFEFLGSYERPNRTSIYYAPTMGWNDQDKFMLGLALYNTAMPEKKLEWILNPMYAFGSKRLVGNANVNYNWYPSKIFRRIELGANFKTFSESGTHFIQAFPPNSNEEIYYYKPWYRAEFSLQNELKRSLRKSKHSVGLRSVFVDKQLDFSNRESVSGLDLSYKIISRKILRPASFKGSLVYANSNLFGNFSGINVEAKYRWNYNIDLKGIDFRYFAGMSLIANNQTQQFDYSLSGQNGQTDYFYDHLLLGRSALYPNALAQQTTNTQGDFKIATGALIGANNSWVTAFNIKADIPYIPFIKVYFDAGLYPNQLQNNALTFDYVGGLYIPLRKDIVEIYVPLVYSASIKNQLNTLGMGFLQTIRFSFNIDQLNPFRLIKQIKP